MSERQGRMWHGIKHHGRLGCTVHRNHGGIIDII